MISFYDETKESFEEMNLKFHRGFYFEVDNILS